MHKIEAREITEAVSRLCQHANFELGQDVLQALKEARQREEFPLARDILNNIVKNASIASEEKLPLCQDCGTAIVFLKVGQEVHVTGGYLYDAVADGVCRGYTEGYLRKSMASQPLSTRTNTGDNTPPIIHTEIVPGDTLKIAVMPKGGGAENMSRMAMLKPGAGGKDVTDLVVKTVAEAGGNPCPPLIIGLGIGGTAERTMLLAKEALLRPLGQPNPDPEIADLEETILTKVNSLGLGPLGLGGITTALAVHAEVIPTHISSLPVAVNLQCHSARHQEVVL